jgi:HK97 family phage prohead protease
MPWTIEEGHGCPPGRPFAVINKQSGKREGCHPSKDAAKQQQKALYANAPKENSMSSSPAEPELTRAIPFEMVPHSDGLTLEGYAAVFNSPTRIGGWEGDFEETIAPGAFGRTLRERTPVLMFEHGKHPLIGSMPLGVIRQVSEDAKGVYIEARLSDNWLIQPVRDAVRDGAVTGMSFRFTVPEGGDTWNKERTQRTLNDVDVRELGPVVFPAYEPTTATVRSALDRLPDIAGRSDARSTDGGDSPDAQPGHGEASRLLPATAQIRDRMLRLKQLGVL